MMIEVFYGLDWLTVLHGLLKNMTVAFIYILMVKNLILSGFITVLLHVLQSFNLPYFDKMFMSEMSLNPSSFVLFISVMCLSPKQILSFLYTLNCNSDSVFL